MLGVGFKPWPPSYSVVVFTPRLAHRLNHLTTGDKIHVLSETVLDIFDSTELQKCANFKSSTTGCIEYSCLHFNTRIPLYPEGMLSIHIDNLQRRVLSWTPSSSDFPCDLILEEGNRVIWHVLVIFGTKNISTPLKLIMLISIFFKSHEL